MKQTIPELLKAERKKSGLSQEKTAWKADLSSRYYQALELGMKQPSLKTVFKLSTAFNLPYTTFTDILWKDWREEHKPE